MLVAGTSCDCWPPELGNAILSTPTCFAHAPSGCQEYCAAKADYAKLRARAAIDLEEKNHELADTVAVLLSLTKEVA